MVIWKSEHIGNVDFLKQFDGVEIAPVIEDNGFCEVCAPALATMWSVYGHMIDGGVLCVADVSTRYESMREADILLETLKNIGTLIHNEVLQNIAC